MNKIDENKKKRKENESGLKQGLLRGGISQIARTGRLQGIAGRTRTLAGSARIPFPGLLILVSFFLFNFCFFITQIKDIFYIFVLD